MDVNHQSVDWYHYFKSIREQCPWSYSAYLKGEIDIRPYTGEILPLGLYQARVYIVDQGDDAVAALAQALDQGEDEWLFSYPGYGEFATPVAVIIQQNRQTLRLLREKLNASS